MIQQHFWKIFIGLGILMIGGAFWYSSQASSMANEGVNIATHVKGNPDAEVVLTKYSDFQCPACAEFSHVVREVMETYGDQIRFEYKHFPLITIHPHAVPAARATEAAGQQGKFFEMHDKLFENQSAWSASPNPQLLFTKYAEEIGLDMDLFRQHSKASLLRDRVMEQYNESRELGLTGTPSFFLNGERMQYVTYQDFTDAIEQAVLGDSSEQVEMTAESESETATTDTEKVIEFDASVPVSL